MKFSLEVQADQKSLFPYLADPRNRKEWQSSIMELSVHDDGEPRVGMQWSEVARGLGAFEMEITACDAPKFWAECGVSSRGSVELELSFQRGTSEGITELTLEVKFHFRGMLGLAVPFAAPFLRPLMKSDLRRAARLVTSRQETSI